MDAQTSYFLLYVADKSKSASYYARVLAAEPIVDVPGITEFRLSDRCVLGLMPVASASNLLGLPGLAAAPEVSKAELYLVVDRPAAYHRRALEAGGREVSPMQLRDWGHRAAYSMDADGHVLAFAELSGGEKS